MKHLFQAVAGALLFAAALSPAQAVVIGTTDTNPNHSNSAPFGSLQAGYFYQQVYDNSAFNAPLSIQELTFYNTITPGGTPDAGDFKIYLATTSDPVMGIANNIPNIAAATLVYDGALPALSSGKLDILLSQIFNYDPNLGDNLLLIVSKFDFIGTNSPVFFDSDTTGALTSSRHYSGPNGPSGNLKSGLITGFNQNITVPEPSTWALMLIGIAGVGFLAMRRRSSLTAV